MWLSIDQSETILKPRIFALAVDWRVFEANVAVFEIAAEPVPVLRPSFCVVGVEVSV